MIINPIKAQVITTCRIEYKEAVVAQEQPIPTNELPDIFTLQAMRSPTSGYEIISKLGKGGNATVYLAKDPHGKHVAIKEFKTCIEEFRGKTAQEYLDALFLPDGTYKMAMQEFEIAALMQHENIIKIEKLFAKKAIDGNTHTYLVMEYVDGKTVEEMPRGTKTQELAIQNVYQLLSALEHAVSHHLFHGDLGPSNVMIDRDGNIKLIDIGGFIDQMEGIKLPKRTHKNYLLGLIQVTISILGLADFDDASLEQFERQFLDIMEQELELKSPITTHSIELFLRFFDAMRSVLASMPFFLRDTL